MCLASSRTRSSAIEGDDPVLRAGKVDFGGIVRNA